MAYTVDTSFVKQFSSNVHDLLEVGSKIMNVVDIEMVTGEKAFFERIGGIEVAEVTSNRADTVLTEIEHSRRMLTIKDYHAATMVDHQDKIKMLVDPTNPYAKKLANALGRKIDEIIVAALTGSADSGKDGGTAIALPTSQKIAAGGTGLTFAKLNEARKIFRENEYDGKLVALVNAAGLQDLLAETEIQSFDYNTVKTLVTGEVDTFMGIQFVNTERVGTGKCIIFGEDALKLGMASSMKVDMDKRADKLNNLQILVRGSFAAVRMEEERVVEISYV